MKNLVLLLSIVLISISQSFAQDRLFFLSGDETDVKITEVTSSEVKYKRMDNLDGPTFSTLKSELFMIKYANGQKEMIAAATPEPTQPATTEAVVTEHQYQTSDSETTAATPSSGLSSAVVVTNEPTASSSSATDKWGRTEADNRSVYKKKIVKGAVVLGVGGAMAIPGVVLFGLATRYDAAGGITDVADTYRIAGALLVVGGTAMIIAGSAVMGSSAKYKKRANMLANGTASIAPSIMNVHSYSGSAVQSQAAYGISFSMSF